MVFGLLISFSIENYDLNDKIGFSWFWVIITFMVIIPLMIKLRSQRTKIEFTVNEIIVSSKNPLNLKRAMRWSSRKDKKILQSMADNMEDQGNVAYLLHKNNGKMRFSYADIDDIYTVRKPLSFIGNWEELHIVVKNKKYLISSVRAKDKEIISEIMKKKIRNM